MSDMRRRQFIMLLGAASPALCPLPAPAQPPAKMPTIGFLGPATPAAMSKFTATFLRRLGELGWIENRTVAIEYRYAEGRNDRAAEIAAELSGSTSM